ncbi:MAG: T9SS type A sorting domain-containing protein [candidate division Zixibacteria bacterium]|nr:T9SS type A sorting domain-containing protein [candidate division Zixibacteria bacterium]
MAMHHRYFQAMFFMVAAGLLFFAGIPSAIADSTFVSGTIVNSTWTKANSPYCVTGDILIAGLTIEPGVLVEFQGNYVFEVAGVLKAIGTEEDSVIFKEALGSGGWRGIFFNYNVPGSELAYCAISGSTQSGIRCDNGAPTVRNCLIKNNSTLSYGGGIYSVNSTLTLTNTVIDSNETTGLFGGGVYFTGSLTLIKCRIINNRNLLYGSTATAAGGGIFSGGGPLHMIACEVADNLCYSLNPTAGRGAEAVGGGIYHSSDSLIMKNCILQRNLAYAGANTAEEDAFGGAIYIYSGAAIMQNCIIADDSLYSREVWGGQAKGGGIYIYSGTLAMFNCTVAHNAYEGVWCNGGSVVTSANSIFYFNARNEIYGTAAVTYSDVQDGYIGTGNIDLHPIFESSTVFRIVEGSPCIDAGDPDIQYNDVCFPPSLGTVRNDMGAHGGPGGCGWDTPAIVCPQLSIDTALCSGELCIELPIYYAGNVIIDGASWANDSLCFSVDTAGSYTYNIIASNISGADTCNINVNISPCNDIIENGTQALPMEYILEQNWPNPFNPMTEIRFGLPRRCTVALDIYNILGQKVATILDKILPGGYYVARWDGAVSGGKSAANGIYFYRLTAGDFEATKKMVLLK